MMMIMTMMIMTIITTTIMIMTTIPDLIRVRLFQDDDFYASFHDLQSGIKGVSRSMMSLEFLGAMEAPVFVEVSACA